MSNIDPQTAQQIVQFLATYGGYAGTAAAGAVGSGAVQALGSGATKAVKSLWEKIRHKSNQEGSIVQDAVTAFEADPHEPEHQQTLSFVLKQLCNKDAVFALEIAQLFNEVQRDPVAQHFIQHISGNAQVGIAGANYAPVTIHQTTYQRNQPQHQLKVSLGTAILTYGSPYNMQFDRIPTLVVYVMNVGTAPSYVDRVEFESIVDGRTQVNSLVVVFGRGRASSLSDKFGTALQPGQQHKYYYHYLDLSELGSLGSKVIPTAVIVYDEIGNEYREPIPAQAGEKIISFYRP